MGRDFERARRIRTEITYKEDQKAQEKGETMIVKVMPSSRASTYSLYTILLKQGVQSFRLDYTATEEECRWYARMFRKALRNSENAKKAKR